MNLIVHNSRPNNQTVSQTSVTLRRAVSILGPLVLMALCVALLPAAAASAQTLTFTGQVYSPLGPAVTGSAAAHGDPIPNILVFVQDPNSPLPVFAQGVTVPGSGQSGCAVQPSLVPATVLGSALTDPTGTFLFNVAGSLSSTVNVVIQAGKWRRKYQYTTAQIASFTTGTTVTLPPMSMPASQSQGDLPHIAVVTGSADQIECIFPQIGVSASEVTDPLGGGSINFFSGNAGPGEIVSSSSPTETQLVNPAATSAIPISNYDMVIFGCQSWTAGIADTDVAPYAKNVEAFANEGGRVFGTHGEATWISTPPDWSGIATFNYGGSDTQVASITGQLSNSYTGEPVLAAWMTYIGALNAPAANLQFALTSVFYNITAVNAPGQTWVTIPSHTSTPVQFSFDTPVNTTGTPSAVVNFTNTQTSYDLGDTGDSVVVNVTDNSATATLSGLTLTLQIPAGISLTSLVDTTTGGAWTCTQTTPTATCVMGAPLSPGASDQVTLTFNIPLTTTPGSNTIIGTLSNGGINQANQCGRVLYNDYHVEGSGAKVNWNNGARCTNIGSLTNAQKFLEYSLYNLSNFIAPTTSDTIVIQSPTTTTITTSGVAGVTSPIQYGQIIGDTNGINAIVATTAPAGTGNGTITVDVDGKVVCTLQNDGSGGMCPNAGFTGQDAGIHTVQAFYSGDTNYQASQSPIYNVTVLPDPTNTSVATSLTPSILGNSITFTATVTAPYATPVGTVAFYVDGNPLGTSNVTASSVADTAVATFPSSTVPVGNHTITAIYAPSIDASGTYDFVASTANGIPQVVNYPAAPTTTTLVTSVNPSYLGQNVTFTATVTATSTLPAAMAGTVTFYDGTTSLGTSILTTTGAAATFGVASIATTALTVGTHSITAVFTPATPLPTTVTSTSAVVSQVVNPNVFTMAVNPTSFTAIIGTPVSLSITITDVGAFNEPVTLSCTGINTETACNFGTVTIPAGGATTNLIVIPSSPHPCSTTTAGPGDSRLGYYGLGLAALALFLARKRRNLVRGLSLAAALCLLPLLNGCGTSGCTDFGDKPGTYTFTVTATSAAPNAETLTQTITMTVNP